MMQLQNITSLHVWNWALFFITPLQLPAFFFFGKCSMLVDWDKERKKLSILIIFTSSQRNCLLENILLTELH